MLSLQSKPWARVIIDGKDTGRFTPLLDLPLETGAHRVVLVNDRVGLSSSFSVTIKRDTPTRESRVLR